MNNTSNLTYRNIFVFWSPLALTWLMMAAEQPILIAIIARLDEAKFNLAAFGIAASFALIIEAPVIMLMSASTALVNDRVSYLKLKRFTDILNISVTLILVILVIPAVFYWLVGDVMGVPLNVVKLTHISLIILMPWAAAIGYRRFYQGILIRNNLTGRVTQGTIVRLLVISLTGFVLYHIGLPGAYVGSAALSLAVTSEAIATRLMAARTVRNLLNEAEVSRAGYDHAAPVKQLTYSFITRFYAPLALTSILSLGVSPFVTFFLGKSNMGLESLAVLPVVSSLVFIFRSMGLSYQEVNIALVGDRGQNRVVLRRFALILGTIVTLLISIIAFTPLATFWFRNVSGLTSELIDLSYLPLKILILLPALSVLLSFQRSNLVIDRNTGPISRATAIELVVIIVVLLICTVYLNMVGVVAASLAFIIGKGISNLYLLPKQDFSK